MVIAAQQSAPMTPKVSGSETPGSYARHLPVKSLATTMPSNRQTTQGIMHPEEPSNTSGDYAKWKKSKLFHPRQAFAAVTAENFLKAKADFSPVFMHNMGATKRALTSVMEVDKPRHSEQVNILA
mgnify:CR=1 FL=1